MNIINIGFSNFYKDENRCPRQFAFGGVVEFGGINYDFKFSVVPIEDTLNIGYYINQITNQMDKAHTHIGVYIDDPAKGKTWKRADKEVYGAANKFLYPIILEQLKGIFPNLTKINVSE
ncbi:MAG: hypothetical protein EKK57_04970 [Proteobacteria bacterium]|nr:MAG: hypothetical protein EKK57_04970 [Pseudomonadota bacterium]